MNLEELKLQLQKDLEGADSTFEKNLLKAEYEHRIKLLGLKESNNYSEMREESDFECIGCGS